MNDLKALVATLHGGGGEDAWKYESHRGYAPAPRRASYERQRQLDFARLDLLDDDDDFEVGWSHPGIAVAAEALWGRVGE